MCFMTFSSPISFMREPKSEDGFTLIEVLVACLILSIVLILLFATILDLFRSGDRSRQRAKAQRNVTMMSERLGSDIRSMRSPNRNPRDEYGLEMMRENFTISDQNLEIHDIIVADPDRLIFFAELDSVGEAGLGTDLECVEWYLEEDQSVHRRVYPYSRNCIDAVEHKDNYKLVELVVEKPDVQNATDKDFHSIFSYYVTEVPKGAPLGECVESHIEQVAPLGGAEVGPGVDAQTQQDLLDSNTKQVVVPGLGPQQVDRVAAIELDLRSLISLKGARGEARYTQKISISSRQQFEFRYAIGCAV